MKFECAKLHCGFVLIWNWLMHHRTSQHVSPSILAIPFTVFLICSHIFSYFLIHISFTSHSHLIHISFTSHSHISHLIHIFHIFHIQSLVALMSFNKSQNVTGNLPKSPDTADASQALAASVAVDMRQQTLLDSGDKSRYKKYRKKAKLCMYIRIIYIYMHQALPPPPPPPWDGSHILPPYEIFPLPPCGVVGVWYCPSPPLWCGGGVVLSPSDPCGVVGVWYGMLGMYGVYGRSGMACLESMVCLVCMVGMLCMAWMVVIVWMVSIVRN